MQDHRSHIKSNSPSASGNADALEVVVNAKVNKGWTYAEMANIQRDNLGVSDEWFQRSVEVDSSSGKNITVYTIFCQEGHAGPQGSHFAGVANNAKHDAARDGNGSKLRNK